MIRNRLRSIFFLVVLIIVCALFATGLRAAATQPSAPTSMTYQTNYTQSYPNGTKQNLTRGYIHVINIAETTQTNKWIGFVGNISGTYGLQDASGNNLYDWTITSTGGEVYATQEGPSGSTSSIYEGGIPDWTNMVCANYTQIQTLMHIHNHTGTDEDSLNNTFLNGSNWNATSFYVGETLINDTTVLGGTGDCYGVWLNGANGAHQSENWSEIMLTDQTYENETTGQYAGTPYQIQYDVIFATLVEDSLTGFNGQQYDYQMILPESGLEGNQNNIAYYFYVELT